MLKRPNRDQNVWRENFDNSTEPRRKLPLPCDRARPKVGSFDAAFEGVLGAILDGREHLLHRGGRATGTKPVIVDFAIDHDDGLR